MSAQSLRQYHDQLKAEQDLTLTLSWFDTQIESHKKAIEQWPHERATFTRLIEQCGIAKQTLINEQHAAQLRVADHQSRVGEQ